MLCDFRHNSTTDTETTRCRNRTSPATTTRNTKPANKCWQHTAQRKLPYLTKRKSNAMNTTPYKGFNIHELENGRFAAQNKGDAVFRADGYSTLNNAKGAITKHLQLMDAAHNSTSLTERISARATLATKAKRVEKAATSDDTDRAVTPADNINAMAVAMRDADRDGWTTQRNDKGDPIHANPTMAHLYAELDYHGMTRERDSRSRNKREGRYAGLYDGKHQHHSNKQGRNSLTSYASPYYAPNRKARKALKVEARNMAKGTY
jgi:hypothetical protein